MDQNDRSQQSFDNSLLRYIKEVETGSFPISGYSASSLEALLDAAIRHGRDFFVCLVLEHYKIPKEGLSVQERLAIWYLGV